MVAAGLQLSDEFLDLVDRPLLTVSKADNLRVGSVACRLGLRLRDGSIVLAAAAPVVSFAFAAML